MCKTQRLQKTRCRSLVHVSLDAFESSRHAPSDARCHNYKNRHFTFLSLHEPSVQVDFKQLKHEDLMQEMHIVDRENHVYAGAESVKYIVRKLPVLWIIAPLIYFPGTAPIWRALYRFIARNRYRIAGKNCDSGSCKLP